MFSAVDRHVVILTKNVVGVFCTDLKALRKASQLKCVWFVIPVFYVILCYLFYVILCYLSLYLVIGKMPVNMCKGEYSTGKETAPLDCVGREGLCTVS